jgi:4-hydroxy-tetrahydrodipicolinate synthase
MAQASSRPFVGVFTALVTPMRNDALRGPLVNEEQLAQLVETQIEGGVAGLVACGTTGEAATLTPDEQAQVVHRVVAQAKGRVPVLVGVGSTSTAQSVALGERALALGAQGLLAVTPYYNKPPQEGLVQHFSALCSLGAPIVLYNVPGRTGCDLLPETVLRLCERPQIVGLKEASGNVLRMQTLSRMLGDRLVLFSGEDALNLPLYSVGARGTISVLSNVVPRAVVEVFRAFFAGDVLGALASHQRYVPLVELLFSEANPIPTKTALHMMGQLDPVLRLPLVPMSPNGQARLAQELSTLGLLS